jgi:transcriptional regulator with PAS, ATPase and Fis domain
LWEVDIFCLDKDPKVLEALELVQQLGDIGATVLITGESGTGKKVIHQPLRTFHFDRI